jgi:hypothetical protein
MTHPRGLGTLGRAVALAALLLALAPAPASAFSKAIWGDVYRNGVNQFPIYHRLGVRIYEASLDWAQIAPTRPRHPTNPNDPAYQWPAALQQAITQARIYHMRVLFQIIFTPSWANGGHGQSAPPRHPSAFAQFAEAAARHYRSVHLWMIWGEPTRAPNFSLTATTIPDHPLTRAQKRAPHVYAQLLNGAYGTLKHVSRRNLVIGGCTYTTGNTDTQQWIENLRLPDGKRPRMDMYAHNPFSTQAPTFTRAPSPLGEVQFSDLHELARWIDHYLRRGMPIFLSEFTIPTAPDQEFNYWVNATVAGQWVTQALREARHWHRIYGLGWIHVYDDPPASYGGLLTQNGVPKPDFDAFENG